MRRAFDLKWFALALFAALVLAAPALAASAPAGEHGSSGGGMFDKLAFTGIKRWDHGFYTLIVFGLLMFILSKYAWPHIKSGLEKRESNIIGALEQAKRERTEAAELLAKAKKEHDETAQKVAAMIAEASKDAEAVRAVELEKAMKDAQAERESANRDIESWMEALKKELMQQVTELAALMASKALRRQVTLDNQRELLDESIAELQTSANKA